MLKTRRNNNWNYVLTLGTATYYKRLGLLNNSVDITDEETDINILFEMALQKLAFMPFAYIVSLEETLVLCQGSSEGIKEGK